jgi:hypothetical protein
MKAFKNASELTRAAAAAGATVEIGGRTINASGARMSVLPRPAPAPAAEPTPAPAPGNADLLEVVTLQARLQAGQTAQVLATLGAIAQKVQEVSGPQPMRVLRRVRPIGFRVVGRSASGEALSFEPVFDRDPEGRVLAGSERPIRHDIAYDAAGRAESIVHVYAPAGA